MGCDIHMVMLKKKKDSDEFEKPVFIELDRNYKFFALLAGVRNEWNIESIAPDRGFSDFEGHYGNYFWLDGYENCEGRPLYWLGDHSFSHCTLDEIANYDYPSFTNSGIMTREDFDKWDKHSEPDFYYQGGGETPQVDMATKDLTPDWMSVRVAWTENLRDCLPNEILKLIEENTDCLSDVELIFGFDS